MAGPSTESSSGQSDADQGQATTVEADVKIFSPSHEHDKSDVGQNAADSIPTFERRVDSTGAENVANAAEEGNQLGAELEPKKKKKKKPKKKGAAAHQKATGFEEFYADAPITPAEAAMEKKEIYNTSRAFPDRIEECIQRYRASRRMNNERTMLFDRYLWLGGIDASPRQFTGFAKDRDALAEADADEIRRMTATDFVGGSGGRFYDPLKPEHWFVDFEGIAKGFLSRFIPSIYMYDEGANQEAADLIKNFLNYVLRHDVCPEYAEDIMAARKICEIAPYELRMAHELLVTLPGTFNTVATELFCDRRVDKDDAPENYDKLVTFRVTALLSALDEKVKKKLLSIDDPSAIRVINTKEETYRVVDITLPRRKDVLMVEEQLKGAGHSGKGKPAGILVLKPSTIEFGFNNIPREDLIDLGKAESEDYLLEDDLLIKIDKGMKIKAIVCELNIGVRFIKKVRDVRVSFDQFLPQMLMESWKDPVPNTRPPPSASSPNAEETMMATTAAD